MLETLLTLALLALPAAAQDPAPETRTRFTKALQKLGADDFKERQAASEEIARLPGHALALVDAELKKTLEPEVRSRLVQARVHLVATGKREALQRLKDAQRAWQTETAVDAYEKVGRKDPKWDAKVRSALPLLVQVWEGASNVNQARAVHDLLAEAIAAGCDDPLILYARARMYDVSVRKSVAEVVALHLEAAEAMKERGEGYHALRRCFAFGRAADFIVGSKKAPTEGEKARAREWLDLAFEQLEKAASDPKAPERLLREICDPLIKSELKLTGDRKIGFDKIFEVLTKARPESTLPLLLKGDVYTAYAWDARGSGWANTVTPDGWKKMAERLADAEQALTEAWKRNPEDTEAPTLMLNVELGQGKGRAVMETWFKRAMDADPNNYTACSKKMYYLEPKWHGSEEVMLAFGRELLAAGNWEARLPFQLVDAHWALAAYGKKGNDYYKDAEVWADLKSVYEPYLQTHPDSAWDRSYYARYACYAGRWAEAKAQFDRLGDAALVTAFKDKAELDRLRAEASDKGK